MVNIGVIGVHERSERRSKLVVHLSHDLSCPHGDLMREGHCPGAAHKKLKGAEVARQLAERNLDSRAPQAHRVHVAVVDAQRREVARHDPPRLLIERQGLHVAHALFDGRHHTALAHFGLVKVNASALLLAQRKRALAIRALYGNVGKALGASRRRVDSILELQASQRGLIP